MKEDQLIAESPRETPSGFITTICRSLGSWERTASNLARNPASSTSNFLYNPTSSTTASTASQCAAMYWTCSGASVL